MHDFLSGLSYLLAGLFLTVFTLYNASLLLALHDKAQHEATLRQACFDGPNLVQTDSYCMWLKFDHCFIKEDSGRREIRTCEKLKTKVMGVRLTNDTSGD